MTVPVSGTEGYAEQAEALVAQYESLGFAENHHSILPLVPTTPCRVLDIGAGTGRDAAGFAALGHNVLAIEPTAAMRERAITLHPSPRIEWLDDSLPELIPLHREASRMAAHLSFSIGRADSQIERKLELLGIFHNADHNPIRPKRDIKPAVDALKHERSRQTMLHEPEKREGDLIDVFGDLARQNL